MAKVLGLRVTAEGVETRRQAEQLSCMNIDFVQGHYYGRPMTPEAIPALIRECTSEADDHDH